MRRPRRGLEQGPPPGSDAQAGSYDRDLLADPGTEPDVETRLPFFSRNYSIASP